MATAARMEHTTCSNLHHKLSNSKLLRRRQQTVGAVQLVQIAMGKLEVFLLAVYSENVFVTCSLCFNFIFGNMYVWWFEPQNIHYCQMCLNLEQATKTFQFLSAQVSKP